MDWAYIKKTEFGTIHADYRVLNFDDILPVLVQDKEAIVLLYVDSEEVQEVRNMQALLRTMDAKSSARFEDRLIAYACARQDSGEAFVECMKAHVDAVFGGGSALQESRKVLTGGGAIAPDMDAIFDSERKMLERYGRLTPRS